MKSGNASVPNRQECYIFSGQTYENIPYNKIYDDFRGFLQDLLRFGQLL